MPLSDDVSATIDFLKDHPTGILILILTGIELLIDFLDFLVQLIYIMYIDSIIFAILDIITFYALYLFFIAGKYYRDEGDEQKTWDQIVKALVYIFIIEIIFGIVSVLFGYEPTILYWITVICPLISLILAITKRQTS